MTPVTIEDRRNELRTLLAQIEASPSRDWTTQRERIVVLQRMIAAENAEKTGG